MASLYIFNKNNHHYGRKYEMNFFQTNSFKVSALVAAVGLSFSVNAADFSNGYVFGDSLMDNGNIQAFSGDPSIPERFTNGPNAAEIVAAGLGYPLTPSLHLIPGIPHGNNYSTATATAVDTDGDESTLDLNLPTQINSFLFEHGGEVSSDTLYSFSIGAQDILNAFTMRVAGVLAETKEERKAAVQAAKNSIKAAVDAEEAQIRKLIAAGAQHILIVNAADQGVLPIIDIMTEQTLALATTARQEKRIKRLPKVATRLSVKFNKLLAKRVAKIERQTGIDIIEFDLFSSYANQIDNAEDFGYTNIDTPCIYTLNGLVINPECIDFPVASGFLSWDEYHPTTLVHQNIGAEVLELILSH